MNGKIAVVLLSGLLAACAVATPPPAPPPPPAAAPPAAAPPPATRIVNIRGATCARFLELTGEDRAAASMFYIGYQSSRRGAGAINVNEIPGIEGVAVAY